MKARRIHRVPVREYSSSACFVHEVDVEELRSKSRELSALARHATREPVTLLYGAKDAEVNHAIVLKNEILRLAQSVPAPRYI